MLFEEYSKIHDDILDKISKHGIESLNKEEKLNNFHPDEIIKNVCYFYKIKTTQIKSSKRDAFLVKPRQVAMYLLKKELGLTYVEIGHLLGGRDHTTIMHGVEKVDNMLKNSTISGDILGIPKLKVDNLVDY